MSSRTYVFLLFPNLLKFFQTQPYVNGFDCSLSGNGEGWQEVCLAEEAKFKKEKAQLKVTLFQYFGQYLFRRIRISVLNSRCTSTVNSDLGENVTIVNAAQ